MKVKSYVHVISEDGTKTAVLAPGDTVPDWATVTNPEALEDGGEAASSEAPKAESTPDTKRPATRKSASSK